MINYGYGVSLSRLQECDKIKVFQWRNDKSIWKWCRQTSPIHWANHCKWFDKQSADPSISMFGIFKSDSLVGVCGFTDMDYLNRRAEFSLYIGLEYQRKGYAFSALQTLFYHGFADLNFRTIWGETMGGNPAIHLFTKFGMSTDGYRRQFYYKNGEYLDALMLCMTREEFSNECVRWEGTYAGDKDTDRTGILGAWDRMLHRDKAAEGDSKD